MDKSDSYKTVCKYLIYPSFHLFLSFCPIHQNIPFHLTVKCKNSSISNNSV